MRLLQGEIPSRSNPLQDRSVVFPNIPRFAPYRVCPPSTPCSRKAIVANYDEVEHLLAKLVDLLLTRLALVECDAQFYFRHETMIVCFFDRITSFACDTEEDQNRILAALESAFIDMVVSNTPTLSRALSGHLVNVFSNVHTFLVRIERLNFSAKTDKCNSVGIL